MIEIFDLEKRYSFTYAIRDINLKIETGEFIGLIGPNGSGKTTLLKLLFGYCRPTHGHIRINGQPPSPKTNSFITFYPEIDSLYGNMRVFRLIHWYSRFFTDWNKETEKKLIEFFNIPLNKYVRQLSKGFRARLKLLLSLSRDADIFLLDEPLSGIDPASRDKIVSAILREYRENQTIIFSTHIVSEAETLFERTIFLMDGSVILDGKSDDLREKYGKSIDTIFREEMYA